MSGNTWLRGGAATVLALGLLLTAEAAPERLHAPAPAPPLSSAPKFAPRFEALAETKLLMEGLAQPNFNALEGHLKKKPADVETWKFARGQALLIAETGNLLLLRPPRNQGRDNWMKLAMNMRQEASQLARRLGNQEYSASQAALANLAQACNRCHETFRVRVRVGTPGASRDAE
jgi:hypothetical protein